MWSGNGDTDSDGKTDGKNGSCIVENGEISTGSGKKGQDNKRIRERYRKNSKARRQTLECNATLVWTREKEKTKLRGKRMMEMAVPGRRKRGKPRRRWMDLAREGMERIGAKEGDEVDWVKLKILSRCGDPNREKPKEEETWCFCNFYAVFYDSTISDCRNMKIDLLACTF